MGPLWIDLKSTVFLSATSLSALLHSIHLVPFTVGPTGGALLFSYGEAVSENS